ncbi:AraC family transcriptional regulator [Maribacter polysaccharolyticus]|uniref:AraC family transcriptional regulator n=1 Tax=Maribacter polysaccharolyticus TaxID=3020831 RepID=UPI00237F2513|nr:helix-turn-helix domain-containing protein [Maribacter polysaccharolyticus]MDE3741612.1 helix-turn-helix transcriptional regulator [Maribacter polysaccharolyticus]
MEKKIVTYNKISPVDAIKIEPFDPSKRYTKPHRHNKYLELVYFQEGEGFHYLDGKPYPITPPIFFFIWKEQIHNWEIDTIPKGYVIIIKEAFLAKSLDKSLGTLLARLHDLQVSKVPKDPTIETLFETLTREIKQNSPVQKEILEGCLKSLLAKIISYAEVTANPSVDMTTKFIALLEKHPKNNVRFYAENLNTTAQNLNLLCKKRFSKTASEVIASYMVQKTKRLLLFTDLSVAEISFFLEFKDTSHFIKYFKRQVGQTPLQFKKEAVS